MAKGTIQLIINEPEQLYIEYRSYERIYQRTRIIYGVLTSLSILFAGVFAEQSYEALRGHLRDETIISVTMITIVLLIGYGCARSYWKAVTFHEQYKALRKTTQELI